jgi:hypothetical protein
MRSNAEYLGGTRFKFTCPQGHATIQDFSRGPKPKRLSETACVMMAKWWKDGVTVKCRKCNARTP